MKITWRDIWPTTLTEDAVQKHKSRLIQHARWRTDDETVSQAFARGAAVWEKWLLQNSERRKSSRAHSGYSLSKKSGDFEFWDQNAKLFLRHVDAKENRGGSIERTDQRLEKVDAQRELKEELKESFERFVNTQATEDREILLSQAKAFLSKYFTPITCYAVARVLDHQGDTECLDYYTLTAISAPQQELYCFMLVQAFSEYLPTEAPELATQAQEIFPNEVKFQIALANACWNKWVNDGRPDTPPLEQIMMGATALDNRETPLSNGALESLGYGIAAFALRAAGELTAASNFISDVRSRDRGDAFLLLIELMLALQCGDLGRADHLAEEIESSSRSDLLKKYYGWLLLYKASALLLRNHPRAAVRYCQQALDEFHQRKKQPPFESLVLLAEGFAQAGEHEFASNLLSIAETEKDGGITSTFQVWSPSAKEIFSELSDQFFSQPIRAEPELARAA